MDENVKKTRKPIETSGHPRQTSYASYDNYPVHEGNWEEMVYTPVATRFSLWAPTAVAVNLRLYHSGHGGKATRILPMQSGENGLWTLNIDGNLKGMYYTFNVHTGGKWLGETPGVMAKAVGINGNRAAVIDLRDTNPQGWDKDRRPPLHSFSDIILYEMHHRDFSMDPQSGISQRGKFLALTEEDKRSPWGDKTGIGHLKELGITHVHLLPSFDFSSIDESKAQFQYNWGYDPQNYNVPEGSYSTDPYTPETRIREFKQMVMALHKAGIRVVMDVAYNHTAQTLEGNFERTVPGYFYRKAPDGTWANASGCGNETASERAMVRRYIVQSVCYWAQEYHVDGFRFDQMGIHDIGTMLAVRHALDRIDPTLYIYGEGWAAGTPRLPADKLATKNNIRHMPGIAAFSDELRDSLRGPFGNDSCGAFLAGMPRHEAGLRFGIAGGISHPQTSVVPTQPELSSWAAQPTQFISYVSCHDDLCLADRLKTTLPASTPSERAALQKLAETAVLTSQGVPLIFAGDELMRDKQGVANSYRSPDSINAIPWKLKREHNDVFRYIQGLIAMRKAHPAFRMGDAGLVRKHLQFIPTGLDNAVAFRLWGKPAGEEWENIIVILNANRFPIQIPVSQGTYHIVCSNGCIDLENGLGSISGSHLPAAPQSAMIAHQ